MSNANGVIQLEEKVEQVVADPEEIPEDVEVILYMLTWL